MEIENKNRNIINATREEEGGGVRKCTLNECHKNQYFINRKKTEHI